MPYPRRPARASPYPFSPTKRCHVPLVTSDVIKDVFTPKQELIAKVTAA
jgi:hypothetical protein